MGYRIERTVEVEWGDCDSAGIVYFPQYFRFLDACIAQLLANVMETNKRDWMPRYNVVGYPIVDTGATFRSPTSYGDVLTIESTVTGVGRTSFSVEHRVMKGDELAVEAYEKRVWVGPDPESPGGFRPVPIPGEVKTALLRG